MRHKVHTRIVARSGIKQEIMVYGAFTAFTVRGAAYDISDIWGGSQNIPKAHEACNGKLNILQMSARSDGNGFGRIP